MRYLTLIILTALLCASSASADSLHKQHVAAFGDRAWIADELADDFQVKRKAAGDNYEHVPVAHREWAIRTELAVTACLVMRHIESRERGRAREREIIERCWGTKEPWLIALNAALLSSGKFPYEYAGQTKLALIPVATVQRVLRATIKHANEGNYRNLITKLVVPLLEEACAIGACAP